MLDGLLDRIHDNVQRDVAVQRSLEAHLNRQLEALMQGEGDRLPVLLESMERDLVRSRELQTARAQLLREIRSALGVGEAALTLAELGELLGGDAEELRAQRDEWREVVTRVRRRNREVTMLVRHSLGFVRDLLSAIAGEGAATVPRGPETYGASGRLGGGHGTSLAVEV